ncbi:hypothetical protein BJ508DRAFT_380421 [Ascobolus immersus RN42]|uniref:Uncharacterized protein n=1 Tax=Ascobolus immersus RN42 TaxID=1160509 RepID=A0A3N4HLU8_ASCIM|nr:hypothetical protein BJ508DRAFT_380421 [Ascobolus immersus RN42]
MKWWMSKEGARPKIAVQISFCQDSSLTLYNHRSSGGLRFISGNPPQQTPSPTSPSLTLSNLAITFIQKTIPPAYNTISHQFHLQNPTNNQPLPPPNPPIPAHRSSPPPLPRQPPTMPARTLDPEQRHFNPASTNLSTAAMHHDHLIYNPLSQTTHLLYRPVPFSPTLTLDPSTLILRTITVRLNPDDKDDLSSRCCVFFGDMSCHNITTDIPASFCTTLQARELYSVYYTLRHFLSLITPLKPVSKVLRPSQRTPAPAAPPTPNPELLTPILAMTKTVTVLTPSQYSVNAVCYWITEWRRNGFCNNVQKPVENESVVKGIDEVIKEIETACGVEVLLWGVRRGECKQVEKYCRGNGSGE